LFAFGTTWSPAEQLEFETRICHCTELDSISTATR